MSEKNLEQESHPSTGCVGGGWDDVDFSLVRAVFEGDLLYLQDRAKMSCGGVYVGPSSIE